MHDHDWIINLTLGAFLGLAIGYLCGVLMIENLWRDRIKRGEYVAAPAGKEGSK